jgi:anti-sigma B factor antagonist
MGVCAPYTTEELIRKEPKLMHIDERIDSDVAVVTLKGDLLGNEDETQLQQKISSLKADGIRKVIVDLGKVNRINSGGISALISTVKAMRTVGGDVRIASLGSHLSDVLVTTRLVQVLDTYETVGRALASYSN